MMIGNIAAIATPMNELKKQKDPRVLGEGETFDNYISAKGVGQPKKPKKK